MYSRPANLPGLGVESCGFQVSDYPNKSGVGLELEINCSGPTNCREIMKARTSRIFAIRKAIPLILASICVSAIGCRDSAIIWSAESRSPDGRWAASASTEQFGGPGTAYVGTQVSLKAVNGSQPAVEVLGLSNDCGDELDKRIAPRVDLQRARECRLSSRKVCWHRYFPAGPFRRDGQKFAISGSLTLPKSHFATASIHADYRRCENQE